MDDKEKRSFIKAFNEIFNDTKKIKAQTTEIGRMLIKYQDNKNNSRGLKFIGPLPWKVTSKEVYLLRQQGYTMEQLKQITGYTEDDIDKKCQQHYKTNFVGGNQ